MGPAEFYFSNIYCVTKAICIIYLNVPFYVCESVAITLLITEFFNKTFIYNFITFAPITMFINLGQKWNVIVKINVILHLKFFMLFFVCSIFVYSLFMIFQKHQGKPAINYIILCCLSQCVVYESEDGLI
jgi:hypothetical protein